jgi:hypothetical protein
MGATIICPVCGTANSAEAVLCTNCQTSLRPSTETGRSGEEPGASDAELDWSERIGRTLPEGSVESAATYSREPPIQEPLPSGSATGIPGARHDSGPAANQPARSALEGDLYEWLRRLDGSGAAGESISALEGRPGPANADTTRGGAEPARDAPVGIPDWLEETPGDEAALPPAASHDAGMPAAVSGLGPFAPSSMDSPAQDVKGGPSETGARPEEASDIDVDAIFASLQAPNWTSGASTSTGAPPDRLPPAAADEEPLAPAALPSWVEAMRPVESILQQAASGSEAERPVERGPLLGLQGVLPAIPGVGRPSNRPSVRAMRLTATEQQRARATLLEQVLADETVPMPLKAAEIPVSQRGLRWAITAVLVLLIGTSLISKSQAFPLPVGVPNETLDAIRTVEAVPEDARVLLVFDYEPATVGEMEASAAPLLDHLLILRHPVLALMSTSPTGEVLGERFLSGALAARTYEPGVGYVNLGYLPGGLAGVRAFSENPVAAVPLAADSGPAWSTSALQGISRLSDFAGLIIITDSLESGRIWIEQTAGLRGRTPLLVVASAQAGPMLLPYAASGQIAGLVAGLNGSVGAELANGGFPGFARRYWDAYSFGLYLAALLIVLGAVWQAWVKIRAQRTQGEKS